MALRTHMSKVITAAHPTTVTYEAHDLIKAKFIPDGMNSFWFFRAAFLVTFHSIL